MTMSWFLRWSWDGTAASDLIIQFETKENSEKQFNESAIMNLILNKLVSTRYKFNMIEENYIHDKSRCHNHEQKFNWNVTRK